MDVYLGSVKSIADHPVLPVLELSIPQWRYLIVDLLPASLQSLSGHSFLNLQRLKLIQYESDLHVDVFQLMRAPVLREFVVFPRQSWHAFEHVPFPWSRLTSVTHFPAFDVEALNYLRTMADLKELDVLASSETRTPIHDVVSLSKLRCLTITESEDATGRSKEFFSALKLPALSELTLKFVRESVSHFPISPLPLGNLTTLDIHGGMNSHKENTQSLLNFLTLTHHVDSLRLSDNAMTLEFVDGLNLVKLTGGSPVRLPCLRVLDIGECGIAPTLNNDLDELFEMLYSRLPAVTVGGKQGAEEKVNANATGAEHAHRRCLKTVRFPRCLYVQTRTEWKETFLELTSRAELECGVTVRDDYA
ncbi:hypothetical protein BDZ89DRAFT_1077153 [Hymenopellis radicata]|nr:hypothetical protein BDZ89DRAFT_1077153 [Hymenopellis radicata]